MRKGFATIAWTSKEIQLLESMHRDRKPTIDECAQAIPRHTWIAVEGKARHLGLRHKRPKESRNRWVAIAAKHQPKTLFL